MAILQSCCCWRSVRKGSIASAYYTMAYHGVMILVMAPFLHDERQYYHGNVETPSSSSIIETGTISHVSMGINVTLVCFAACGILASLLLLVGLRKNARHLLLPWIVVILINLTLDILHSGYLFVQEATKFNPMTAMIFTLDFFLLSLNVYAMLCVLSQYQELKAGRGRAEDDESNLVVRVPAVRYNARPTATSCLSTRRDATYHATRVSPTQSPSGMHSTYLLGDSARTPLHPSAGSTLQPPSARERHVKFPADIQQCPLHGATKTPDADLESVELEVENSALIASMTGRGVGKIC